MANSNGHPEAGKRRCQLPRACSPPRLRANIKANLDRFAMDSVQEKRMNLLSIGERSLPSQILASLSDLQALICPLLDGGSSGLPALYTMDEILSRLAFDLKSNQELTAWRHFKLMIGSGRGGCVYCGSQ
jgi:hypothetical protein